MSWFPRRHTRKSATHRRPKAALTVQTLESRLNPSFSYAGGVLIISADVASSSDYVRVESTGTATDGSTGVKVRSNLVNGGAATVFGSATDPVLRVTLDMKDGNDNVWVGNLGNARIRVGEGNGRNAIFVGDCKDIGVIAGNGSNLISVGRGLQNLAGGIVPGNVVTLCGVAVLAGWSYTVDNPTGAMFAPIAPIGNNNGSNIVIVDNNAGDKAIVDVAGNGCNLITTGHGDDTVWMQGNSNSIIASGKGVNQVQVDGNGHNAISNRGTGSITVNGQGSNLIDAGNNVGSAVFLNFTGKGGYNLVKSEPGANVTVNGTLITANGKVSGTNTSVFFF